MKQTDLDRAVAQATGETVSTIKRLGFLLADPDSDIHADSDEHGPYVIDWDALEAGRYDEDTRRPTYEPAVA